MKKHLYNISAKNVLFLFTFCLINASAFSNSSQVNSDFTTVLNRNSLIEVQKQNRSGFLENQGQMTDMNNNPVPFVLFKAEATGLNLWITTNGITLQTLEWSTTTSNKSAAHETDPKSASDKNMNWERIDMILNGAQISKTNIIKENAISSHQNFFYPHCAQGLYGVKQYEKITIKNVYPGIDWVWYSHPEKGFKYDFIVHPGADYKQIELAYYSKQAVKINSLGQMELFTKYGTIKENTPVSFCESKEIKTSFNFKHQKKITMNNDLGYETVFQFEIPEFNSSNLNSNNQGVLVIDPQLVWGTFIGGNQSDDVYSVESDESGNIYMVGGVSSNNFPTQNLGGAYFQGASGGGFYDVFIVKFSNVGDLLWSTYYGGTGSDIAYDITFDVSGNIWVTGNANSANLPVLNPGGGAFFQATPIAVQDIFILKFTSAGTLLWSTYFGGNNIDDGYSISCDNVGNVFITGTTTSTNFTLLDPGGGAYFQPANAGFNDAYIVEFSNTGVLLWSTYYGGAGFDHAFSIDHDNNGNTFICGSTSSNNLILQNPGGGAQFQGAISGSGDVFILKFLTTRVLNWGTYYGGSSNEDGYSLACDDNGNVFVTGRTNSADFPVLDPGGGAYFQGVSGGARDAFLLKFSNTGVLNWATYFGGAFIEYFWSYNNIAIDHCGNVYITFMTESPDVPTQASCFNGYQDNVLTAAGGLESFLANFSNTGILRWATYMGSGNDGNSSVTVDPSGNLFFASTTFSNTHPHLNSGGGSFFQSNNAGSNDGVIAKFTTSIQVQLNVVAPTCLSPCGGTADVSIITPTACTFSYLWSTGATTNSVNGLCAGSYSVTVTLNEFCRDTIINFTINPVPPINTTTGPFSITTCVNTAITPITHTTTSATGIGAATGLPAGVTASFAANTITISGTPSATGTFNYTIPLTGGCGSVDATGTITVNPDNTVSVASSSPTVCVNTVITNITHNTTGATGIGAATGLPIGVTANFAANTITISGTPNATGTFNYSIPLTGGCGTVIATGTITVNPDNTVSTPSASPTVCVNLPITPITFSTTGATGIGAATGLPTGVVANFAGNTITISGTPTATGIFNYSIPLTGGCGTVNASGTITVISANTVNGPFNVSLCMNTLMTNIIHNTTGATGIGSATGLPTGVTANFAGNTITISGTPTTAGTFNYIIPLTGGCGTVDATGTITVYPQPTAIAASNSPICEGQDIQLNGGPNAMTTYNWTGPNAFTSNQQNATINNATTAMNGIYTITVTDANNCSHFATVNVVVNTQPTATANSNSPVCEGQAINLTANNFSGATYSWSGPNAFSSSLQNLVINPASISNGGNYTLTVSVGSCTATSNTSVVVHPTPTITLVNSNDTCSFGSGAIQANINNATAPLSIQWSNGSTSANLNNLSAGTYSVLVTDANSCQTTASATLLNLEVDCQYFVYLANAFSPNGDGVNDIIQVHGKGVQNVRLVIYNRWGNKVFETEQLNDAWDGTFKGDPQNAGVFIYMLEGVFINGKTFTESGDITLIR